MTYLPAVRRPRWYIEGHEPRPNSFSLDCDLERDVEGILARSGTTDLPKLLRRIIRAYPDDYAIRMLKEFESPRNYESARPRISTSISVFQADLNRLDRWVRLHGFRSRSSLVSAMLRWADYREGVPMGMFFGVDYGTDHGPVYAG